MKIKHRLIKNNDFKFRKIGKILIYLLIPILVILLVLIIYFLINRDEISRNILLRVNEMQKGEVKFEEIAIAPFAHFPDISLSLNNVSYFENKTIPGSETDDPICKLENIYISFNIIDLISGDINVSKVTFNSGYFSVITYRDSSVNLINARSSPQVPDSGQIIESEMDESSKTENDFEKFLAIDDLTITNVAMLFENRVQEKKSSIQINDLEMSFGHIARLSEVSLESDLILEYYQLREDTILTDKPIEMMIDFSYNSVDKLLDIKSSQLFFEGARFEITGMIGVSDDGDMDLKVNVVGEDFSILNLVLREHAIEHNRENLLMGNLDFEGLIKGKTFDQIPFIEFSFGVKNVTLHIPKLGKSINNLNFDAFVTTGKEKDLSEAYLKITNFSAQLPDGNTRGELTLHNINKPHINLDWYLKTDISGFNDMFKIDAIDSLGGIILINTDINGEIDLDQGRIVGGKSNTLLDFKDVSIRIPSLISLDKINGRIEKKKNDLNFIDLQVRSKNTDLNLNGKIYNFLNVFFKIDSDIKADINLVSDTFDLPEVFSFEPGVGRSFNHKIRKLDLNVIARSTTTKLKQFNDFPAIDFEFELLNASFDDFPDIKVVDTGIKIFEDTAGFNIKFDHMNIFTADGKMEFNGAYNGSGWKPYSLIGNSEVEDIYILDLLNQFELELDSNSVFNSIINGSFDAKLEFPKDSIVFKTLRMANADLEIFNLSGHDTILSKSLMINLNDVYYDLDIDSNPMASLTADGLIGGERIYTSKFDVDSINLNFSVRNGLYKINTNAKSFFGADGYGTFICRPWGEKLFYRLKYSVNKFAIEDLLATLLDKPVLEGNMSFSADLAMSGDDWDNLSKELNGNIRSEGNDLVFYGLDIDKVLENVERSQNFTLLDAGAVLLTGPVGLAVTKGSDLAILIASNPGEMTPIPKIVSNWDIQNGKIMMNDVAFRTSKNRIAAQGYVNLSKDTIDVTFAILNKDGSSKLSQNIFGSFKDPQRGEIEVLQSLLSPVTNLFNSMLGVQSDTFYTGSINHPE